MNVDRVRAQRRADLASGLRRAPAEFDPTTGWPLGETWATRYAPLFEADAVLYALGSAIARLSTDVRLGGRLAALREHVWNGRMCDLIENYGARRYDATQPNDAGRLAYEFVAAYAAMSGEPEELQWIEEDLGPELTAALVTYIEENRERWAARQSWLAEESQRLAREVDAEAQRLARQEAIKELARPQVERMKRQYMLAMRQTMAAAREGAEVGGSVQ